MFCFWEASRRLRKSGKIWRQQLFKKSIIGHNNIFDYGSKFRLNYNSRSEKDLKVCKRLS